MRLVKFDQMKSELIERCLEHGEWTKEGILTVIKLLPLADIRTHLRAAEDDEVMPYRVAYVPYGGNYVIGLKDCHIGASRSDWYKTWYDGVDIIHLDMENWDIDKLLAEAKEHFDFDDSDLDIAGQRAMIFNYHEWNGLGFIKAHCIDCKGNIHTVRDLNEYLGGYATF